MRFLISIVTTTFFLTACENLPVRSVSAEPGTPPRQNNQFLPGGPLPNSQLLPKPHDSGPPNAIIAPIAKVGLSSSVLSVNTINDRATFESMAVTMDGIIKSASVKFLIDNRTAQPEIYFINGNFKDNQQQTPDYARYHYYFAQKKLGLTISTEQFNDMTYFASEAAGKKFIAGTVQQFEVVQQGENSSFFGIQFYPQDKIAEQTLLKAATIVKQALRLDQEKMSVILYGSQQTVQTITQQLQDLKITVRHIENIVGSIPVVPMNVGDAWGYLRLSPPAMTEELKPDDIVLFKELPLDLSVVAGVVTEAVQDGGSHVNLKSKERNTPNVVVRDANRLAELKAMADQPIHLMVRANGYQVEPSTNAEVKQKLQEKSAGKPWKHLDTQAASELLSFDQMAAQYSSQELMDFGYRYGGKAAKLALLAHKNILGIGSKSQKIQKYRLTPIGFSVPMSYYQQVVELNPSLSQKIKILVNSEEAAYGLSESNLKPLSTTEKIQTIQDIQKEFYKARLPDQLVTQLKTQIAQLQTEAKQFFPKSEIKKVKVRSSANAEDIENFDGAGLHDSFGAKLKDFGDPLEPCELRESTEGVATKREMFPTTILCAVKGVYASLWNKRAVEERSFAHIIPGSAAMGLAINQSYDFRDKTEGINEIANAVVITRILNTEGIYGYQISLNTDDNLVTNPTPNTQSEINLATFIGNEKSEYTILQYAKPVASAPALKNSLVSQDVKNRIVNLVRALEQAYCKSNPRYYPQGSCYDAVSDPQKKKALDVEVKIYSNGEVLVKQVREFSGR